MNPVRRRRLLFVLLLVFAAGTTTALVAYALQRNVAYLFTPAEVLKGEASSHGRFRLGGMVEAGSFNRDAGSLEARFRVTDGDAHLPVSYTGILPDLFRENQSVIVIGRMDGPIFVADQVLAKHDETYTPREVADKMGAAHQRFNVPSQTAENMH